MVRKKCKIPNTMNRDSFMRYNSEVKNMFNMFEKHTRLFV